jgi:hypothetical protein
MGTSVRPCLVVIIEYTLFVLLSLSGAFKAPRNISICGYMAGAYTRPLFSST